VLWCVGGVEYRLDVFGLVYREFFYVFECFVSEYFGECCGDGGE